MSEQAGKQEYTRKEVLRVLGLTGRQLGAWERRGLVARREVYRFSDLIALRSVAKLRAEGVSIPRVQKALASLKRTLRDSTDPFREFRLYADGGKVRVQVGEHKMVPESGQLLLDFDRSEIQRLVSMPRVSPSDSAEAARKRKAEAERWFQIGVEMEQSGACVDKAMEAYELAVTLDAGLAPAHLNIGTLYFTMKRFDRAESAYRRALEANPAYALAHFNLGNLHDERGDRARALAHYREALRIQPDYADAHYNLALLYQAEGQVLKAVSHWRTYLKLDPGSQWAEIARRELRKLYASTVVEGAGSPAGGARSS